MSHSIDLTQPVLKREDSSDVYCLFPVGDQKISE